MTVITRPVCRLLVTSPKPYQDFEIFQLEDLSCPNLSISRYVSVTLLQVIWVSDCRDDKPRPLVQALRLPAASTLLNRP